MAFPPPPQPPVLTSVTPSSLGQGATGQALTLTGYGFVSPMFISFSDHNIAGAVVVTSDTTATATIETVGATAAPGLVSVATWGGTSNPLTFTVTPAPILVCTPPNGTTGVSYSYSCTISGGVPPYTCYATGLPAGMSIATVGNTCVISGMPNLAGVFVGSVTVVDSNFGTTSVGTSIVIGAALPVITSPYTVTCTLYMPCSYQITATNNPFSFNAGDPTGVVLGIGLIGLPPGMSVNMANGLISGIPTTVGLGLYWVGVSATNNAGTGGRNISFTINSAQPF